ncbi:uncharacterized protein MONOS_6764 [Monocercomonoides exilis]|uniref:uncharacterized protein n=1 Tax=Monocercomonoides exilis TaxID=2049356 RepID=UPI00355A90C5|nr:hypothetical protein MONOS_6764 [Monocercomonoides exilis]|eukprot:MONOS_6764.1-p1 / transcript=MONOS_6764.1 / gene=MONOS_6764 / organism=Monocercomonoides_exilis_PA203 / gene_product=unspecified product / transcript_product=unspecified product / location=Mono_scaffold00219:22247-23683(+) / protein_length=386 / sequence_SO=supercontig / SO=protein_coding / is_pseudo=false
MAANKCTKIFLRIISIVLMLLFLAATIIGIIATVNMKGFAAFGVGVIIFGVLGLGVSVCGFLGAAYNPREKGKYTFCIVLFFIVMMVLCIVFVILGIACICIKPTIEWIMTQSKDQIVKIFSGISKADLADVNKFVKTIITSVTTVGVVCCVIGGVIFFVLIVTSFHMGYQLFFKFFIAAGSIVMFVVGIVIAGLSGFLVASGTKFSTVTIGTPVFVVVIVVGALLLLWGLFGLISACCGHKSRCLLFIYLIGVIILFIAFLAVGIVGIAAQTAVFKVLDNMCSGDNQKTCLEMQVALQENLCGLIKDDAEKAKCMSNVTFSTIIKYMKDMLGGWLSIVVAIAFIIVIFLFLVMISACMACKQKPQARDDLSAPMPDYRQHRDVAY